MLLDGKSESRRDVIRRVPLLSEIRQRSECMCDGSGAEKHSELCRRENWNCEEKVREQIGDSEINLIDVGA